MGADPTTDGGPDWQLLGVALVTILGAGAVAAAGGLLYGGTAAVIAAVIGGVLLLFYLAGTTGSASDTVPGEAIHGGTGTLGGTDMGFAVRDTMLFVAIGLLGGGIAAVAILL